MALRGTPAGVVELGRGCSGALEAWWQRVRASARLHRQLGDIEDVLPRVRLVYAEVAPATRVGSSCRLTLSEPSVDSDWEEGRERGKDAVGVRASAGVWSFFACVCVWDVRCVNYLQPARSRGVPRIAPHTVPQAQQPRHDVTSPNPVAPTTAATFITSLFSSNPSLTLPASAFGCAGCGSGESPKRSTKVRHGGNLVAASFPADSLLTRI